MQNRLSGLLHQLAAQERQKEPTPEPAPDPEGEEYQRTINNANAEGEMREMLRDFRGAY